MNSSTAHIVRLFVAFVMIGAMSLPAILKTETAVWFTIEQERIARELCEQKEVKGNCCQGSCVLQKELDKSEETSTPSLPISLRRIPEFSAFIPSINQFYFITIELKSCYFSIPKDGECSGYVSTLDQPPSLI